MSIKHLLSVLGPEVMLSAMLVLLLLLKIFSENKKPASLLVGISLFFIAASVLTLLMNPVGSVFGGMFITTSITVIEKSILLLATFIISLLAFQWLKSYRNYIEFYLLLISILLGMFLMISSGHFLVFYLGLEMATIPLAALSAFDLEK